MNPEYMIPMGRDYYPKGMRPATNEETVAHALGNTYSLRYVPREGSTRTITLVYPKPQPAVIELCAGVECMDVFIACAFCFIAGAFITSCIYTYPRRKDRP